MFSDDNRQYMSEMSQKHVCGTGDLPAVILDWRRGQNVGLIRDASGASHIYTSTEQAQNSFGSVAGAWTMSSSAILLQCAGAWATSAQHRIYVGDP